MKYNGKLYGKVGGIYFDTGLTSNDWDESVKNNTTLVSTVQNLSSVGNHTLKIWMVDPGVVLEKITIETGEHRKSYLGAPESFCKKD